MRDGIATEFSESDPASWLHDGQCVPQPHQALNFNVGEQGELDLCIAGPQNIILNSRNCLVLKLIHTPPPSSATSN